MMVDDDRDALAAEYVLGTLDPDQRVEAQAMIARDPSFAALVRAWERRLGELNAMVGAVEPPAAIWPRIKSALVGVEPSGQFRLPIADTRTPVRERAQVVSLTRRMRRWRDVSILTGALAAVLAALVVLDMTNPDYLPEPLRRKPQTVEVVRTVEVPAKAPSRFVAVLQKDAASPAFLLTVDVESRTLTVRTVAADQQPGKSYELWLVSDRFPVPRSLGLVGAQEFTVRPALAAYDRDTINSATYAVSLEPEGGSPSGVPTGPVLFAGKLVEVTP
jgi:anti-sigma-K factor RskA